MKAHGLCPTGPQGGLPEVQGRGPAERPCSCWRQAAAQRVSLEQPSWNSRDSEGLPCGCWGADRCLQVGPSPGSTVLRRGIGTADPLEWHLQRASCTRSAGPHLPPCSPVCSLPILATPLTSRSSGIRMTGFNNQLLPGSWDRSCHQGCPGATQTRTGRSQL